MVMTQTAKDTSSYRAYHALSVTGLFPGFACPHFIHAHSYQSSNIYYIQRISSLDRVDAMDVFNDPFASRIAKLPDLINCTIMIGDPAIYAYLFGHDDIVVGTRQEVSKTINKRFSELSTHVFKSRTAASFAWLFDKLPEINNRAFT
jgi:hypothetical protein